MKKGRKRQGYVDSLYSRVAQGKDMSCQAGLPARGLDVASTGDPCFALEVTMSRYLVRAGVALFASLAFSAAHAVPLLFHADLSGANESPANASPGFGTADIYFDSTAHTMRVVASFSGLIGNATAAHIHGPTASPGAGNAGVMTATPTFPGFPLGVTSGDYDLTFDMSLSNSYNPAFLTAQGGSVAQAESVLLASLNDGKAYFNIHSTVFPAGEIRGFLNGSGNVVAEPATLSLLLIAGLGLAGRRRRIAV